MFICAVCNGHKSNYYETNLMLVNPYEDDPNEHLLVHGAFVWGKPVSVRGIKTEQLLRLNRPALIEKRMEVLERLKPLIDSIHAFPPGPNRELLREQLIRELEQGKEFTMVIRDFLKSFQLV